MTFSEKSLLSESISLLNSEKLARVVSIIQSRAPKASSQANDKEIEIDLDKLDAVTLRQIEKFVKSNVKKKRGKKGATVNVQTETVKQESSDELSDSQSDSKTESDSDTDEEKKKEKNVNGEKDVPTSLTLGLLGFFHLV